MCDNQKDIKVSVGCLAYNHEKYIRKTLDGFVRQITDFDFEVWVHDDASTDHTPDIIQEYADKYPTIIKPIYQQENQYTKGICITYTYIYPQMHGKYLAFCEGDDYWNDPYKLQKQFDALETHPKCSISTHKVQCCKEDGAPDARIFPPKTCCIKGTRVVKKKELLKLYYLDCGYPFQTSSYFYRREVIEIDLEYPSDAGVLRRCLISGEMYYIDEPMSTYRRWSIGSLSSRRRVGGNQAQWKHTLKTIVYENNFDRYTGYIYHDYINVQRLRKLLDVVSYPEYRQEVKKILKKYDLTPWKVRKRLPPIKFLKIQAKYILGMYFPECYSDALKLWLLMTGYYRT